MKPYTYAHRAVREGGIYIFLLDGGEGLCGDAPSHDYTVRKYLLDSFEELKAKVASGEITDIVGVNVPMYHSMVRKRVKKNYIVSIEHAIPRLQMVLIMILYIQQPKTV